jgi:CheY-like chemotaxis protein
VAKILVADDNSNIQKMVGLALKDHGIEVVAVGNGEAAVRKISDVKPDLVLADVFMPVRNGYEVCKYVKDDASLSHIPVILLVGAFDPLDEQEAQKAGADGVLKKPFVPPDPLISMVKSALVRAGVAHAGFSPKQPEPEAPAPILEIAVAPKMPFPTMDVPQPIVPEDESFVDEVPTKPMEFKIDSADQPVAFGSLLETADATTDEAPEFATTPVGLDADRNWGSSKEKDEDEEEEPSSKSSWRRDAGDAESSVDEGAAVTSRDFRGGKHGHWSPRREKEDLTDTVETLQSVPGGMMDRRDMPAGPPFAGEAWAAAIDGGSDRKTAVAEEEQPRVHPADLEKMIGHGTEPAVASEAPMVVEPEPPQFVSSEEPRVTEPEPARNEFVSETPALVETPKRSEADSWFSTPPPNPWEAEAQKVSQLASTWHSTVEPQSSESGARGDVSFEPASAPDEIEVVSGVNSEVAVAAAETVREEASQAVEQVERQVEADASSPETKEAIHDAAAHLDMDAVVAKVLARLSPDLLTDATREILKPVVEAVVREELNSRKS